jgi:hypothetical protein
LAAFFILAALASSSSSAELRVSAGIAESPGVG